MKREIYNDYLTLNEKVKFSDEKTIFSSSHSLFYTDVVFKDYNGDKLIRVSRDRANITLLGGRIGLLEQTFGFEPDIKQHLFLNNALPEFPQPTIPDPMAPGNPGGTGSATPKFYTASDGGDFFKNNPNGSVETDLNNLNRYVGWFCIGTGGESDKNTLFIHQPKHWETRLYNQVPFRVVRVNQDLPSDVRKNYGMKTQIQYQGVDYFAYWAKKLKISKIYSVIGSQEYRTDGSGNAKLITDHSNPCLDGHPLKNDVHLAYVTIDINIEPQDFKEYYRLTHNDRLDLARLSEFGLIKAHKYQVQESGIAYDELSYPELFAKITHNSVFLTSEGSRRDASYNIYS